ncbi:MAG TPA: sigma-70 family RNA polymerase sigma factor [Blastocatellia bacterium]|nr:sigma-70 family RNA polymerase sigma factor [Blastocatellia bacterium]
MEERALNAHNRNTDERRAIEAAQKDPARFAELYENNFERVYAYIARRVRDRNEAEDVTSEVFHQALANLPKFQWRGAPFAAWLFRIAANSIIDRGKRAAREQALPEGFELPSEAASQVIEDEVEQRARLFQLVGRLPEDQRLVISKRFSEEKSIREIANEIGRSEGAVKQLQFRAVQTLRAWLTDEPGDRNG